MKRKQASLLIIAVIFSVIVLLILLSAKQSTDSSAPGVAPEKGAYAPQILRPKIRGETLDLEALRGQWVILNFWATWCVPCRAEMPELQALYEDNGVMVIGVNQAESQEMVSAWLSDYGITYPIILDLSEEIYQLYRVRGQPTTYLINPDGLISEIILGETSAEYLLSLMQE
jgi:thiol-disulfide isomerase/thioredoxin